MKKRGLALLLAAIMVFGSAAEGVSAAEVTAAPVSKQESTERLDLESESTETADTEIESTETANTENESTETANTESESTETANTESESTETAEVTETMMESTETVTSNDMNNPDFKMGGLRRPENVEVDWSEAEDVFEADIDSTGSAAYNSEWDCYSTNYYYNMLNDDQKALWDQLDAMCLGYLTGNESLKVRVTDNTGKPLSCFMTQFVNYSNMTKMQASDIVFMFKVSNPQYYFLDNYTSVASVNSSTGRAALTIFDTFGDGGARASATAQFKAVIDSWVAQINSQPSDLLKEKKAHDMICEKVIYDPGVKADPDYSNPSIPKNRYNQVVYSVFFTESTVCAGYSQAMQLLCNAVGIDCAVVTSIGHEWNIVRLNGSWYYVDLTWNDEWKGDINNYGYVYFNRSLDFFMNDNPTNVENHKPESVWISPNHNYLPVLKQDSGVDPQNPGNYGTIFTPGSTMAAPEIIQSNNTVNISSPSGGTVYYTTDGRIPSPAKTKSKIYTGPFAIPDSGTVKAVAVADGNWDSEVAGVSETVHKVTFDSTGGSSVDSVIIVGGLTLSRPADPSRSGYTFAGWCTDASGKNAYNFANPVSGNLTLYAKWTAKKYKITLNAYGGYIDKKSVKSKKKTVTYNKTYGSLPSPKRGKYVFLGWYTKKSGGSKITSSSKVKITGNKTYYARWTKVKTKKASISSVKSKSSGKMTVKIKNISTASGYQIRYSLKSNMSSAKTKTTSSLEKSISSLKKGKKYYVQVRMYQKESQSGKKHYGSWSSRKSIKIKK